MASWKKWQKKEETSSFFPIPVMDIGFQVFLSSFIHMVFYFFPSLLLWGVPNRSLSSLGFCRISDSFLFSYLLLRSSSPAFWVHWVDSIVFRLRCWHVLQLAEGFLAPAFGYQSHHYIAGLSLDEVFLWWALEEHCRYSNAVKSGKSRCIYT